MCESQMQTRQNSIAHVDISGRRLARNTVLNLVGRVVPLLVAILTVPYVIHHLGPDRYGLFSLAWIVIGYFALFDLGIGPATTKFVAELLGKGEIEKLPELVWTAVATQTCLGLVGGLLLAALSPFLVNHVLKIPVQLHLQAELVFLIMAAVLPFDFASASFQGVLGASQRFDLLNAISIPGSSITYLLPVGVLAIGFGLPGVVFSLALARIATLLVAWLMCARLHPAIRHFRFDRTLVRSLLGFGGWVTVSSIVGPILVYFDRFLIGAELSVASVGFYAPPYLIATKLWILPTSLMATLFPAFSTSAGRGDSEWIRKTLIRSLKFLILTLGPISLVLAFFARPILTLWLGATYANEGTLVLQIMSVAVFANSLAQVPYNLLYGIGRPDLPAKFHAAELPFHIGLVWYLVAKFGLPGAAIAWAARVSLDFVLLLIVACWITRTPARVLASRDLRRSAATVSAMAVGFVLLGIFSRVLITDTALILLLTGGFFLVTWHYVLNLEEKWQIRLWLKLAR